MENEFIQNFKNEITENKIMILNELINIFKNDFTNINSNLEEKYENYFDDWIKTIIKFSKNKQTNNLCKNNSNIVNKIKIGEDISQINYSIKNMNHNEPIYFLKSVSYSYDPNISYIASCSMDKLIKIWNPITGELKNEILNKFSISYLISYENYLSVGGFNGKICIHDLDKNEVIREIKGHSSEKITIIIQFRIFFKDFLVSGSKDGEIKIWSGILDDKNIENYFQTYSIYLIGHFAEITNLLQISDLIVSGSLDKTIRIWNINGDFLQIFNLNEISKSLIHFNNNFLFAGCNDGIINIFDIENKVLLEELNCHNYEINCLLLIPGDILASADGHGIINLYNINQNNNSCNNNFIEIFDKLEYNYGATSMIYIHTNSGILLASAHYNENIIIWSLNSRTQLKVLKGHSDTIYSLINVPVNGRNIIASAGRDKLIKIWDVYKEICVNEFNYKIVAFSVKEMKNSEFDYLIIVFENAETHVWKFKDAKFYFNCFLKMKSYFATTLIKNIYNTSNYYNLIAIGSNTEIQIFDINQGDLINIIKTENSYFSCLEIISYKNTNLILTGSFDGTLKIVDQNDYNIIFTFTDESTEISCISKISFLGSDLIAAGTTNGTLRFYNLDDNTSQVIISGNCTQEFNSLIHIQSNDKNILVISASFGLVRIIDLNNLDTTNIVDYNRCTVDEQINSLNFYEINDKKILLLKSENKFVILNMNLEVIEEHKRNEGRLIDCFLLNNRLGNYYILSGWAYGLVRVTLFSYIGVIESKKEYKNYICGGHIFNK